MTDITSDEGPSRPGGIRWFAVVLLLGYLALVGIGMVSISRIAGDGLAAPIAMGVFVVIFLLGWRWWLAAGSARRLAFRERVTVNLVGGSIVVVLASPAHLWLPALIALSVVVMCDSLNERGHSPEVENSVSDLI